MMEKRAVLVLLLLFCASYYKVAMAQPLCQQRLCQIIDLKKQVPDDFLVDSEYQLMVQRCRGEVTSAFNHLYLLSSSACVHDCGLAYTQCNNACFATGDSACVAVCLNELIDCMPACYVDVAS